MYSSAGNKLSGLSACTISLAFIFFCAGDMLWIRRELLGTGRGTNVLGYLAGC